MNKIDLVSRVSLPCSSLHLQVDTYRVPKVITIIVKLWDVFNIEDKKFNLNGFGIFDCLKVKEKHIEVAYFKKH